MIFSHSNIITSNITPPFAIDLFLIFFSHRFSQLFSPPSSVQPRFPHGIFPWDSLLQGTTLAHGLPGTAPAATDSATDMGSSCSSNASAPSYLAPGRKWRKRLSLKGGYSAFCFIEIYEKMWFEVFSVFFRMILKRI